MPEPIAFRRPQITIPYAENAPSSVNLHEGRRYREFLCRLSGTLNIGTAVATAVKEDAPYGLLRELEIMVNGNVPIKTLSGKALLELTALRSRCLPTLAAPGTGTGNHAFSGLFLVPLWLPDAGLGMDSTLLSATREAGVTGITMQAQWNDAQSLVTPGGSTVLTWTTEPTIEVVSHDLAKDPANPRYAVHRERTIIQPVSSSTDRLLVDINSGPTRKVVSVLIIAREAGARTNGIINNIAVETENDVRYKMSATMNREATDMFHERETARAGVYKVDIAPRNLIGHGAELSGLSAFDLVLDVTAGAASELEIIVQEVIGNPAGFA